jgi:aminoglycoside phosphotransferase (APT) family kinase protein
VSSARVPDVVARAARRFGFDPASLRPLPGASRQTWELGDSVLRVRPREALSVELAAMAAAADVLPVPRVLATAEVGRATAVLLQTLPGAAAGQLDGLTVPEARRRGVLCGRLHAVIGSVRAPQVLPEVAGTATDAALLHLDLHPFNVLIQDGRVSAVLDWANAARGRPDLDRARTLAILTLDPAAVSRCADPRWTALTEGWIEVGELAEVPADARAWAYRHMLTDLAHRYPPPQLAHVRAALAGVHSPN